jgi:hypothetical protein
MPNRCDGGLTRRRKSTKKFWSKNDKFEFGVKRRNFCFFLKHRYKGLAVLIFLEFAVCMLAKYKQILKC